MKVFTYSQYIKNIHKVRLNHVLREEEEEYKIEKENNNHVHDKLVKNILKDKKELEKLVNDFLHPKVKIKEEELIKYTNSYINKRYKAKEADLVYKMKNKEMFFLIEHQSSIDIQMPYRILNYCIDIIQEWSRNRKLGKNTLYPLIIPIVIYTGNKKWDITKNFKEKQIKDYIFEKHQIDLEYNLIDINKISDNFLIQENSMFSYAMLIEKAKNKTELINYLRNIIKVTKDKEKLDEISDIIIYILDKVLEEQERESLLKEIDGKVGDEKMSTLIDRLIDENKRIMKLGLEQGVKQGVKQGVRQGVKQGVQKSRTTIVENMLKINLEDEIIIKTTGIQKQELEKIKNNIVTKKL